VCDESAVAERKRDDDAAVGKPSAEDGALYACDAGHRPCGAKADSRTKEPETKNGRADEVVAEKGIKNVIVIGLTPSRRFRNIGVSRAPWRGKSQRRKRRFLNREICELRENCLTAKIAKTAKEAEALPPFSIRQWRLC
jgi:hypothetical protein